MQIQYNCVTPNRTLFLENVFQLLMHMCRPFAPNVMFLYIILHMAVKLSRHQCQCFAFSYHI